MPGFFKMFFASLLAIIVASLLSILVIVLFVGSLTGKQKVKLQSKTVLVLDLSQNYREQLVRNPFAAFSKEDEGEVPGLYDVVRMIEKAKDDKNISGILIVAKPNANGFAASEEIRNVLLDFKKSKKFIYATSDVLTQKSYYVASAADQIFLNPSGAIEWLGFTVDLVFFKGTLDKLDIQPQIFYAGKFKSATEPFRTHKMTPENKLQTTVWLNNLYAHFLQQISLSRKIDTATLHRLANEAIIQTPQDAFNNKLVDGLKYDDQIKELIRQKLRLKKDQKINFITINQYADAGDFRQKGKERIALIYAQGDIIDGKSEQPGFIASEDYVKIICRARLDKTVKAIVFRVNSGGGSALASENIWRELSLAKKEKPLVVSFGDVAASGGYYISCAADSIFAEPNTITGSIGVFAIIPNMEGFFKNKLGITFDGVKTGNYGDGGGVRPMSEKEKQMVQQGVEKLYKQFKQRVATGRKKSVDYIDSIAQGRVWSGNDAIKIGLVDKLGNLQDAIDCAARMAKLKDYRLKEYPEPFDNVFDKLMKSTSPFTYEQKLKTELGEEFYSAYRQLLQVKRMVGTVQARLPFEFSIR
ncbi:MAG: signal peptide peptidase SppA [Chitinophagaceae bacterium]